jgi:threonine synthase
VDIVLPTGAMGNIVGGYMCKLIGVPLGYLCSGVNINDITHRVMETGQFHKSDAMLRTLSDAINIQVVRHVISIIPELRCGSEVHCSVTVIDGLIG